MTFTTTYIAFIIFSIFYRVGRITKSYSNEEKQGKVYAPLSYAIMLMLYLLIIIGSIFEYFYCWYVISLRNEVNLIISLVGFLMYVGAIPIRAWSIKHLKEHVSHDIKINENHRIVKDGPYQYVRHPLALCVIIEVIGFTLISNSWFSTLATVVIFLPYMLYRIHLEETALIDKFGYEYLDYQKEVGMFIPWRWRRNK